MNLKSIRSDLEAIDGVVDVTVYRRAVATNNTAPGERVVGGDVSKLTVDVLPGDSTEILIPVMKDHRLVLTEVRCGVEGFAADLRPIGRVADAYDEA